MGKSYILHTFIHTYVEHLGRGDEDDDVEEFSKWNIFCSFSRKYFCFNVVNFYSLLIPKEKEVQLCTNTNWIEKRFTWRECGNNNLQKKLTFLLLFFSQQNINTIEKQVTFILFLEWNMSEFSDRSGTNGGMDTSGYGWFGLIALRGFRSAALQGIFSCACWSS